MMNGNNSEEKKRLQSYKREALSRASYFHTEVQNLLFLQLLTLLFVSELPDVACSNIFCRHRYNILFLMSLHTTRNENKPESKKQITIKSNELKETVFKLTL